MLGLGQGLFSQMAKNGYFGEKAKYGKIPIY